MTKDHNKTGLNSGEILSERAKAIAAMNELIKMAKKGITLAEEHEKLFHAVTAIQTFILKKTADLVEKMKEKI